MISSFDACFLKLNLSKSTNLTLNYVFTCMTSHAWVIWICHIALEVLREESQNISGVLPKWPGRIFWTVLCDNWTHRNEKWVIGMHNADVDATQTMYSPTNLWGKHLLSSSMITVHLTQIQCQILSMSNVGKILETWSSSQAMIGFFQRTWTHFEHEWKNEQIRLVTEDK